MSGVAREARTGGFGLSEPFYSIPGAHFDRLVAPIKHPEYNEWQRSQREMRRLADSRGGRGAHFEEGNRWRLRPTGRRIHTSSGVLSSKRSVSTDARSCSSSSKASSAREPRSSSCTVSGASASPLSCGRSPTPCACRNSLSSISICRTRRDCRLAASCTASPAKSLSSSNWVGIRYLPPCGGAGGGSRDFREVSAPCQPRAGRQEAGAAAGRVRCP